MSPDMLTLVAAVLVYDRAYDVVLDKAVLPFLLSSRSLSRNVRSETKDEKDMALGTVLIDTPGSKQDNSVKVFSSIEGVN